MIPRNVYIDTLGWCWIRPLEYGDIIEYQQRPRRASTLSWLSRSTICGFDPSPTAVKSMAADVPGRLEAAILRASDIEIGQQAPVPEQERDYRDDSPFAQPSKRDEGSIERSIYWLHEQGYTYHDLYGLLLGEIDQLSRGFEEAQNERDQQSGESNQTTPTAYGNKGDRASQLGWR